MSGEWLLRPVRQEARTPHTKGRGRRLGHCVRSLGCRHRRARHGRVGERWQAKHLLDTRSDARLPAVRATHVPRLSPAPEYDWHASAMNTQTCGWCAEEIPANVTVCPHCQGAVAPSPALQPPSTPGSPSAPAGWYDDPQMADTRRYWDGQRWTVHVVPKQEVGTPPAVLAAAAPASFSPTAAKDDTSYVWGLVLLPLVGIVLDWTVPAITADGGTAAGFFGASIALVFADARRLKENGIQNGPSRWWVLLIPGYLIARTRRIGSAAIIPIAWFLAFGASALSVYLAPFPTDWTGEEIASDIEAQFAEEFDTTATVTCPSIDNALKGDSIDCDVREEGGETATAHVEFDNDSGYTWQIR